MAPTATERTRTPAPTAASPTPTPAAIVLAEGLDDLTVTLDTQRAFRTAGHVRLRRLWSAAFTSALATDAATAATRARPPEHGPRTPVTTERMDLRRIPVATGPLLEALHPALTTLARTLSGRLLVPSFAVYGFLEGDDECILHYDTDQSDLTLLIMALGRVAPLRVHPELRGASEADLGRLECDPGWDRRSGIAVPYSASGLTAIRGRELPHHRPRGDVDGLAAVAALHYRSVFPT